MPPSSIHSCGLRLAPKVLDPGPDLVRLFKRAIDNPASITRAENNEIRDLPPPDDEDRQICETLTCDSKARLVSKAVAAPDSLTREEVDYLIPRYGSCLDEEDDRLMFSAIDAINLTMSSDEKTAVSNAHKRQSQRWKVEGEACRERGEAQAVRVPEKLAAGDVGATHGGRGPRAVGVRVLQDGLWRGGRRRDVAAV